MTNNNNNTILDFGTALGWRLRAEFWATSSLGDDLELAEHVAETLHELNLPPLQLERIQEVVLGAVQRVSRRGQPAEPVSPVQIRIWVASEYASDRGSGFFLVERPGCDLRERVLGTGCLLELFLYQERDSQQGR